MARKVFYSFHYTPDCWRTSQVRNIGAIEGNKEASDNDWETVKKGGDSGIQKWIDGQMSGRSACIVLVGANTANRKWIDYEIKNAWKQKMGIVGIRIHNLKDNVGSQSIAGANPFDGFNLNGTPLNQIIKLYSPPYWDSKETYHYIADNVAKWVEESIQIRAKYN